MNQQPLPLFASALLAVLMSGSTAVAQNPGNGWLSTLQEGKQQASKTGKPLMVVLRCQP